MQRLRIVLILAIVIAARAASQMVGINVLLDQPPTAGVLAQIGAYGQVRDVMPEINAVTVKARIDDLASIQALPCVAAATVDSPFEFTRMPGVTVPDFANGGNMWNLDAINVTDFGTGRTVPYDGDGVYVAVFDSGLLQEWREYFPEQRIATQYARAFRGGGGEVGHVSTQPNAWELDTQGHGTWVTGVVLGFSYFGTQAFNGVAPKATVIPIDVMSQGAFGWSSVLNQGLIYVANLKASGALGNAPVVATMSLGAVEPQPVTRAAIQYAISKGVVFVACAGNEGAAGMLYPAAYPEVISVAAAGWTQQFPLGSDPVLWTLNDYLENDPMEAFITGYSSRELPGQELDLAAPTHVVVPGIYAGMTGTTGSNPPHVDYTFFVGTSAATPHVAGVAALMLQKNPNLTQSQVESILEATAMPLAPGCRAIVEFGFAPGNLPSIGDLGSLVFFPTTACWGADAAGHGLLQADAALNATPMP